MKLEQIFTNKIANQITNQITNPQAIALLGIILLSFAINVIGINWGLPNSNYNSWAADEIVPRRVLEALEKGFANGWHYKYPPVQFYLLALFYSPVLLLHQLNLVNVYDLSTYTLLFYLGRFLTVLMAGGLLAIVYLCGREIFDQKSALFTTLITSLSINYIYYSKVINLEIPYLFWFMLSILFYLKILKSHQLKDYLLFALMAAFTVATKDQGYAFYLLTPFFIVWQHYRICQQQQPNITFFQSLLDKKITRSIGVGLGSFLLLHNVIFNLQGFFNHVDLIIGGNARIHPMYEANIFGQLKMLRHSLTHLRFSMGWPFYALCLIGFCRYLPKIQQNVLLYWLTIPFVSYYLFYIALLRDNDVRYLMPLGIMLAFFGGKCLADWLNPLQGQFRLKAIAVTVLTIYTLGYGFTVNALMVQDSRYAAEAWMKENIPSDTKIFGAGDRKFLPRLEPWDEEIVKYPTPESLSAIQPDYIVFSSGHDISRFAEDTPEYKFFAGVMDGTMGYDLIWQYESTPTLYLWNREEVEYRKINQRYIYSNFDKINPRIKIFQRRD